MWYRRVAELDLDVKDDLVPARCGFLTQGA
jgi:hypothetical protein